MFLGQLLVNPTNVQSYVMQHGDELDESAGLFQRATAFKVAIAKGKATELNNEIEGLMAWRQSKVDQLGSMGKPKGPGGVRDILNVQSQIAYTEQEIMRKSGEIESLMATAEVYGPGALQLQYRGPETRRQVEIIGKEEVAGGKEFGIKEKVASLASNILPVGQFFGVGPSAGNSLFDTAFDNPTSATAQTVKAVEYGARSAAAAATFGTSELVLMLGMDLFGQKKKSFSGEGVKGFITDAGKDFSNEQASVAMINKMQSGVQAIYSPILGDTPILTKVTPRKEAAQIKNVGVEISPATRRGSSDTIQAKAIYGGLLNDYPEDVSKALFVGSIIALAAWLMYTK